jgi:hypothetical protein
MKNEIVTIPVKIRKKNSRGILLINNDGYEILLGKVLSHVPKGRLEDYLNYTLGKKIVNGSYLNKLSIYTGELTITLSLCDGFSFFGEMEYPSEIPAGELEQFLLKAGSLFHIYFYSEWE